MHSEKTAYSPNEQYSALQIFGIWLAALLPVVAVAWGLLPLLIRHFTIPAVKLYWILTPLATVAQLALVAWIVRREEGAWTWSGLKRRLCLNLPRSPVTERPSPRRLWWILPWAGLLALTTAGGLVLVLLTRLRYWTWPPYTGLVELASPGFAGQWWWVVLIMCLWTCSVCAEEFLFRGVLLPRMKGAFGGWHGAVNGLLYGVYHVYKPWAVPFRLVESVALVRPARRFGSTMMSISIRGAEGLFVLILLLLGAQAEPFRPLPARLELPAISRQPAAVDPRRSAAVALRLAGSGARMPSVIDRARIMELGKNPGLGVRQLHAQGITGREIGIGIVDMPLLTGHQEYRERLQWYEEVDTRPGERAQMHGAAVASIAVGHTVGVAPEARLYFIGIGDSTRGHLRWYANEARGIRRLLELNRRLPEGRKIRVISLSVGWRPGNAGYDEIEAAVREAMAEGLLVVSSDLATTHGFKFQGLGRSELADPDQFQSYEPGLWWAEQFTLGPRHRDRLLIPMDSRTTAAPTGDREYVFYRQGGWSWSIPYIAGAYALAAQVDPTVTPERFWAAALKTGRVIALEHGNEEIPFGPIIDPPALIAELQRR